MQFQYRLNGRLDTGLAAACHLLGLGCQRRCLGSTFSHFPDRRRHLPHSDTDLLGRFSLVGQISFDLLSIGKLVFGRK